MMDAKVHTKYTLIIIDGKVHMNYPTITNQHKSPISKTIICLDHVVLILHIIDIISGCLPAITMKDSMAYK